MPSLALIVNPRATDVTPAGIERVEAVLRRGADLVTWRTEARDHASELAARAAESADAVVVFAGDGTYNEVVNGVAGRVPLGFLPGGGASVLARTLGLPGDPAAAAERVLEAIAAGRRLRLDLGRVNGRLFCFAAGVGLDAEVVRRVDARGRRPDGRRPGDLAFVRELVAALWRDRGRLGPQLEIDGRGRAAFALVACGRPYTYAGPLAITLVRGGSALELAAPEWITPVTLPSLVWGLLRGGLGGRAGVVSASGLDRLDVLCDRPLPLQVDGEDLGDVEAAAFEVARGALTVFA